MASPNRKTTNKLLYFFQLFSALTGVGLSLYLFIQHTRLKSGIQESASFCTFGKFADCDAVNVSQFSEIGGVPIAAFGALVYFLIFLIALGAGPASVLFTRFQKAILFLGLTCIGTDAALFFIQIFVLKNFCLFCVLTYVCSFAIVWSVLGKISIAGWKELIATPRAKVAPSIAALIGVGIVIFGVAIFLLTSAIRINSGNHAYINNAIDQFYAQWPEIKSHPIEFGENDGTFGDRNSKVKIVEFSDFECLHCRKAAFTMHTALKVLGNKAFFVFKHYPLDMTCNPVVQHQMHPNACALARLGVCATKKGNFWKYHDIVFFEWEATEKSSGPNALDNAIRNGVFNAVFTPQEIQSCLQDEKSLAAVTADINLGNQNGVKGTPAVYVNGKAVGIPVTLESLSKLVEIESR